MKLMHIDKLMRRLRRGEPGIASVELAICLPLLVLMLFGTIDIGRLLFDYHLVSKSVRDATRYLARSSAGPAPDGLALVCPGGTLNQTSTPAVNAKTLALKGTLNVADPNLLGYWTDPNSIQITARCINNLDGGGGKIFGGFYADVDQIVSVTMSANVSFPFMNGWLLDKGNTLSFTVSHEEAHFGD